MSKYIPKDIRCNKETCFAYYKGACSILTDTKFKNKECPFYKPKEAKEQ